MSYNDGSRLLVFGLSFAHQDSRKMQQVLGYYRQLPDTTNRAVVFAQLNTLAKDLMSDRTKQPEIHAITDWMQHGGPFPLSPPTDAPPPSTTSPPSPQPTPSTTTVPGNGNGHRPPNGQGRTLSGDVEEVGVGEEEYDRTRDPLWWQYAARHPHAYHGPMDDAIMGELSTTQQEEGEEDTKLTGDSNEPHEHEQANSTTGADRADVADVDIQDAPPSPSPGSPRDVSATGRPNTESAEQDIECPICAEDYPATNFPRSATITESCTHPDLACLACLEASIAAVIERGALHLLACPICPAKFSSKNIEQYASSQVYERYKYLKEQAEIPGHYVSCMNPRCGGSQPPEGDDPKMNCKYCGFATCVRHRRPWHEGQTCSEFDLDDAQLERLEEEEATAKLLTKENTSICPRCGQGVTKTEGCDHMRCACGEEWCYICSCSFENVLRIGLTAHATFCIYHPNKVNLTKNQREAARNKIMGLVHGGEVSAELTKARDELREKRRADMRPKIAEAAEARRISAIQQQRESGSIDKTSKKKKVKLVAPWEEGGRSKRAF